MPVYDYPMPAGGVCGDALASELRAAGVPVADPADPTRVSVFVEGGRVVVLLPSSIYVAACRAAVAAHKRPAEVRPRAEADLAADLAEEMSGHGMTKQAAKVQARILARLERREPGLIASLGLATPTLKPDSPA